MLCQLKSCQLLENCTKYFEKGWNTRVSLTVTQVTLKVTQGHQNCRYLTGDDHFLLVVYSNYVSILHRCQDIATCTVYVTACDLEKSFGFDNAVEITKPHVVSNSCV